MLLIKCPWCGERNQIEFSYGGDANKTRPKDPDAVTDGEWHEHVFIRDNPNGPHLELWQHSHGCRSWFKVLRNTVTHDILATGRLDEELGVPAEEGV